jgi:hypothetical protein
MSTLHHQYYHHRQHHYHRRCRRQQPVNMEQAQLLTCSCITVQVPNKNVSDINKQYQLHFSAAVLIEIGALFIVSAESI